MRGFTIKGVQRLAVADDGHRVIVVKLVVKLVVVRVGGHRLPWGRGRVVVVVLRCRLVLLAVVVSVAALRTDGER